MKVVVRDGKHGVDVIAGAGRELIAADALFGLEIADRDRRCTSLDLIGLRCHAVLLTCAEDFKPAIRATRSGRDFTDQLAM